jgi:hypothetical protein
MRTAARTAVIAGTATAVSGRVAHRQQQRYMEEEEAKQQTYAMPAGPPMDEPPGYTEELERLAQLKARGILSEEEFQAKKRQILGL